jgi:predicted transcriptional regulator
MPLDTDAISIKTIDDLPIKQQVIAMLDEDGLKGSQIAQALDITQGRVTQVKNHLKSIGLTGNIKRLKKAVQAHDKILKTFNDSDINNLPDKLKLSDVNTCIDRVLDRSDPKINQNLNVNVTKILPIDLSKYANDNT